VPSACPQQQRAQRPPRPAPALGPRRAGVCAASPGCFQPRPLTHSIPQVPLLQQERLHAKRTPPAAAGATLAAARPPPTGALPVGRLHREPRHLKAPLDPTLSTPG
jgi:hypothetical protein